MASLFDYFDNSIKGFAEADETTGVPDGLQDEGAPSDNDGQDYADAADGNNDDYMISEDSYDNTESNEEEGEMPDPLANVDDSEKSLISKLRDNMAAFYRMRENDLDKILSSNIATSDNTDNIKAIIDKYKTSLELYKEYLRNGFNEDPTSSKVATFIEYKALFNTMNKALNEYFRDLGIDEISTEYTD